MEATQDINSLWQEYQATKQPGPDMNALWQEYQSTKSQSPLDAVGNTFKQGVQDLGNVTQISDNTATLPARNNLATKYKAGTATRQDYEQALLEGAFNNPLGKLMSGLGETVGVLPTTALNNYVNPAIARNTGATPEEVSMAEMTMPFALKGLKALPEAPAPVEPPALPSAALDNAMSPLIEANKGNTFAKSPNPLDVGLEANQGISKAYSAAQDKVSISERALRQNNIDIPAADFVPQVNKLVNYLSDKILPDTGDSLALNKIKQIADGLGTSPAESVILDSQGDPIVKPAKGILNSNDLLDIRQAINSIVGDGKFLKSGDAALINAKAYVDNVLKRGAESDPAFAKNLTQYKTHAQDIASRFTGNKALRPFWQPEDAIAYKASLNPDNVNQPGYSDTTLNRAAGFLDNLNAKNKAGAVAAVSKALPKDHATAILRAAIIKARKANPGTLKAVGEGLITASPRKVISTLATPRKATPLTDLAKNAKNMRKQ